MPGLLRARLALLAAGVLWSLGGVLIKVLSHHPQWQCSAAGITFYRSLFAALALAPLLRERTPPRAGDLVAAVAIYALLLGLYVASTQGTTAANAIFLQYTAPVYALVLGSLFFREPVRARDVWALAGAMAGIAVLFFGSFRGGEELPLLMGLGSGLMFGLFMLWLRRMRYADPVAVTALNNFGVAALAAAVLLFARPAELTLVPEALAGRWELWWVVGLLVFMGAAQIAAPYVLFSYGLRRVGSVEASLLALVEPILNPVWVVLFFGERPSASTILGGAIIVGVLALRYGLLRDREEPADPA